MVTTDRFTNSSSSLTAPFSGAGTVIPNDDTGLDHVSRSLHIGGAGNIRVQTIEGDVVTFAGVTTGWFPGRISKVFATGTTATNIVAVW